MADNTEQGLLEVIPLEGGYEPIELRGGALPYKGLEFPTEQRLRTTYYVGNPVGTQTVGGPTKPQSTMSGRWMDQDLGEGNARRLVRAFEALCERAVPVEVRWGGRQLSGRDDDPAVVRRGLIRKFTPKYNRAQDVEWSCEFEWRGEDIQTQAPTFASSFSPNEDFAELQEEMAKASDQTESWVDVVWSVMDAGSGAMLTVSDALDDVQNAIIDAMGGVEGAIGMLAEAGGFPSEIADRVRGMCDQVIYSCQNGRAALDDVCGLWPGMKGVFTGETWREQGEMFREQAMRAKLAMYPTDDPLELLDGQTAEMDLVLSWDLLAERAAVASARLASQQVPDIIAIVRPPAGSDLRDLAVKYYGDPDLWFLIADFNDLSTSEVPATPTGPSDDGAPPIYIPRRVDYSTAMNQTWGDSP